LLFTANPVFINQVFTSYNDLPVGCMFIITVLLGIQAFSGEKSEMPILILLGEATMLSCLVKFTGPFYTGVTIAVFGLYCLIRTCIKSNGNKLKDTFNRLKAPLIIAFSGFFIGTVVLGFNPYMSHLLEGKHLLHPVLGPEKYDIMNTNAPKTFSEKPAVGQLFYSLFSETTNSLDDIPKLKIPFTIGEFELDHVSNPDTRVSGFGVWFSGCLAVAFLLGICLIVTKTKIEPEILLTIFMLIMLAIFFPESWWARYAPFTYYLPVFLLAAAIMSGKFSVISKTLFAIFLVNAMISGAYVAKTNILTSKRLNARLADIKAQNKPVTVHANVFTSNIKLLSEYGIDYEVSHTPLGDDASELHRSTRFIYKD